jgi:hypothetical protein
MVVGMQRFVSPLHGSTWRGIRWHAATVGWHLRLRLCQPSGLEEHENCCVVFRR